MKVRCERSDTSVWRLHLEPTEGKEVTLDGDGLGILGALLDDAAASDVCRVIVLDSAPGCFCKGMDLKFILAHAGEDHSDRLRVYAQVVEKMRASPKVTLCLVDGEAQGGGVGLMAAADAVFATGRSKFSLPEVVFGLIPAMVMPILFERMPRQKARWMATSTRPVKAAEAQAMGLVDEVVDGPIELESLLRSTVKRLLRAKPSAVARLKGFTDEIVGTSSPEGLEAGAQRTAQDLLDLDTMKAIQGFLGGEIPPWFERYKWGNRG